MAGPAPGTKEQTALRWNQEVFLKPSRGRASPHKLLWTTFFVTLVLTLSLYATRAAPASQIKNVWMPSMDHSSFVRMRNAGLSTLGVMLIGAMPNEPVWVYLGFRCVVTLATFLASLAQELPSSMLPIDPALTPAGQPSVALPVKAPAASMNTQSGAFTTNGQPSMAPPSKAAATDMLAAAGLSFTRVSSVDQPHTGDMSTSEAPSPTRPLSRLPRRVREAARVEPISTEKAGSTAGKAEPLAAKGQQPVSPKAQPSNSCPSVLAANAGISSADSPADMSNSTSPIKGVVETAHSEPTGPETFEEPLAKVNALRPMTPSDESFAKSTIAASPDGFTFFSQTAAVAPPGPKHGTDAMTDAVFKFFPKQPAVSQPLHSGSLPLLSSPLLPDAEMASEAHSVQPDAMPNAAGMPRLPSVGEAIAEVAPMPSSKNSTKPPRHPRIKALLGSRGKGQPVMPPAITPTKSPAPVPTGSFVGAVMGEPTTPGPVLASPSVYAKIESLEPPTPGTPMGSPMNWSPIPLMADAAPSGTSTEAGAVPFGTLSKALNTHSIAGQILSPIESELSTVKSPLKSLSKAFALPRKAPEKASTRGKGLAGSPPAKVASKLLSPIKIIFGSSTAAGKVDAASDQLPLTSSLAQEASVPTTVLAHSVDPGAAAAAASSSVQSTTNAPISPPRVHSQAGNPAADSAPFVGTSGANCMPSFLGTSRSPIRKPDLLSDVNSKAVLTKLAGSQSIRTSTLALPRAPHRAGVPQPGTAAPEKGPSRNPFATFGLPPSQTAPEGVSVKSSSLLRSRSVLKRLASKGKENSVAGSSSHVEVASVSAHQPLAISSKFGGVTGAHSSLLTSRPVSEQSSGIGHQTLNAPSFRAQPVSVLSSSRSSPVQPQLFASNHAVPVAAVSSISHGDAAVKVHQDISDGKSASFSSSPKMGSALDPPFRPQQAASTMSRARPSSAIDSMAHQGINLSFTSSPKLSPLVLAPREATSLTPWRVAATPGSVLTHVHSADPDQAMLHAPQKPHAISTPVFEGTRLFKLGKLDRGRPRLVKKAGQERTKVPPAPVHQSVRQLIPQTPSADGGFNSLLMGGRQLAFQDPAAAAPGPADKQCPG
ncbi:MAG: hypothetical protein FRX49_03438 [Trebouxia sp. A1-2]|nr:MAG: hypothetical protein FRX49_03438 [Trebouxia sp. A1-2]